MSKASILERRYRKPLRDIAFSQDVCSKFPPLARNIYRVLSKIRGPLAEEIAIAMADIKYGKSRKSAFKNLAFRIDIPEFTTFITTLTSGEQLGISLGNLLKIQGKKIREKQQQKIQEKAYKIPIKLLFPLVVFILPGIFIVILGPAVIKITETLF